MKTDDTGDATVEPSRRRLLVLSFHAPPGGAVGGLRWWGLSRHLARRGWRVRLVTAVTERHTEPCPHGMTVERTPPRPVLAGRYHRWKTGSGRGGSGAAAGTSPGRADGGRGGGGSGKGALRTLRRELGGLLTMPDEGRGWLIRAAAATRRNISRFDPAVVVSTGPPHSVHLAAWAAAGGKGTPWIADFRDPWGDEAHVHLEVDWVAFLVPWLEALVVRSADRVLTTTPELAAVFRSRFPGARIDCLPNGVDVESLPRRKVARASGLSVVHLGTLYHRRDPVPAVRSFALFLRQNPDAADAGSSLRFVGHMEEAFRSRIETAVREEGIGDRVELSGVRPRKEALDILARCGVSLVLAQDQETAVPAKIYEAVGMGVPTLVVTEPESATGAAARRLGAAVHRPQDLEGMATAMEEAWTGGWTGEPAPGARVDYADLAEEAERLLLNTVAGP